MLGKRRWGETSQELVMTETREEMVWQVGAGDRMFWDSLEFKFLDCVLTDDTGASARP